MTGKIVFQKRNVLRKWKKKQRCGQKKVKKEEKKGGIQKRNRKIEINRSEGGKRIERQVRGIYVKYKGRNGSKLSEDDT